MIHVEDSVVIGRPVEEVFSFVADQENAPRWQAGLSSVRRTTPAPVGVGTRHVVARRFMGRTLELTNEYTVYEPNRRIAFTGDGSSRFEVTYTTEPTPQGTVLACQMRMEPGGALGLAEGLIARGLKRDFRKNFHALKRLLEGS